MQQERGSHQAAGGGQSLGAEQVRNALARVASRAGAGLLEVQLPIGVLRRGPKAVQSAFREALSQHRCARGLRSASDMRACGERALSWL